METKNNLLPSPRPHMGAVNLALRAVVEPKQKGVIKLSSCRGGVWRARVISDLQLLNDY